MSDTIDSKKVIGKIADEINARRRSELVNIYEGTDIFRQLKQLKDLQVYKRGNKSKSMRKVASYPYVVDRFFAKIYGEDYYKDKDFFLKHAPEWLVVHPKDL